MTTKYCKMVLRLTRDGMALSKAVDLVCWAYRVPREQLLREVEETL